MKSDRKPPIVKSPLRLRPRRTLRSGCSSTPMGTPASAKPIESAANRFGWNTTTTTTGLKKQTEPAEHDKYSTLSCEFNALEKFVQDELSKSCAPATPGFGPASQFERGRLYDVYSTRRNERLSRRLGGGAMAVDEAATKSGYKMMGTAPLPPRKKEMKVDATTAAKKLSSAYVAASGGGGGRTMMMDRSEHPRYALRSIKKPPLPVPMSVEYSAAVGTTRKTTTRGGVRSGVRRN